MDHLEGDALWSAASAEPGSGERDAAERHAAACDRCARALDEARALLGQVSALPSVPTPALAAVHTQLVASQRGSRRALVAAVATVGLSLGLALAVGHEDELAARVGVHCLLVELLFAAAAFGAAWRLSRRVPALDAPRFALFCTASALLGQLYLHVRCPAAHALPHLLSFHVVGVAAALFAAALAARWLLARTFGPR